MRYSRVRGVTLIDTLVGSALMLVVFLGIAAAFELSVEVVSNNKARAGAIALANERMEYLKSLTYPQIGVEGGIPAGNVPQLESVALNGVSYTRRIFVAYTDDPKDGLGAADTNGIIADFKTIRVEVSWVSRQGERSVALIGRVSPTGVETAVPGGVLTIIVVDANNIPFQNAQVQIVNASTSPIINITTYTGADGTISFIGAPAASNYQIVVSKTGYSTAQTYPSTAQNPNPTPRHLTVVDDQTTSSTFAIDLLASKNILTYKQIVPVSWTDPFTSDSLIATSSRIAISGGEVTLTGPNPYVASGFLESVAISSSILAGWNALVWTDTTPAQTDIRYRVYDATAGSAALIPDAALPGNAAGFSTSPVDLSGLSTSTYRALAVRAELSTADTAVTPSLQQLEVSYDFGPEPFPNFTFTMRGNKTIGNSPTVYKYDSYLTSNSSSEVTLGGIEWDTYTIGVTSTSTYEIAEACGPQPETLQPGGTQTSSIYVLPATSHSLLVDARDSVGALVPGASVRLTRTGYDKTEMTSSCGQSFFSGLTSTTYSIEVTKAGYQPNTTSGLTVSGDTKLSVVLQSL
ncbi:MAG: carboxypeptidase regulatory-like domain-containing protein [Minisyncoccota bacterium]